MQILTKEFHPKPINVDKRATEGATRLFIMSLDYQ